MPQLSQTMELQRAQVLPEFIDAHCHLNLFKNPEETLDEARLAGVSCVIATGGSAKDSMETVELSRRLGVFAVIGVGPDFASHDWEFVKGMKALIKGGGNIVGIGEIGIDMKVAEKNGIGLQREVFEAQLDLANELEIPVVIHSRGALDEIERTLKEKDVKRAMFHFYDGSEEQAQRLARRGYSISIPPVENAARKKVIKSTNLNSIVAETDSPIVGKTPADVVRSCEIIADLKGIGLEEVAAATTENIRRLFYI